MFLLHVTVVVGLMRA